MSPLPTSFPRQAARTRGFTLGHPRSVTVAPDGGRVAFLRSAAGDDPMNALWVLDLMDGRSRLVADPRVLLDGDGERVPAAEAVRRERAREVAGGFVAYDTDRTCAAAVAALDGRLFLIDLVGAGPARVLPSAAEPYDPRLSPTGEHVAYVAGGSVRVVTPDGRDVLLVGSDNPDTTWGSAEYLAGEELGRTRGHWWSPDGRRLAVARVDVSSVDRWYLSNPAEPAVEPVTIRYPLAGAANASVTLWLLDLEGGVLEVSWPNDRFPYLVDVAWTDEGLLLTVQSRDQRTLDVLGVDLATGVTSCLLRQEDRLWVELVRGSPAWLDGQLVTTVDANGARRLAIDGKAATPADLQVRTIQRARSGQDLLITASDDDPTVVHVYRVRPGGSVERLTDGSGVHRILGAGGDVVVISSESMTRYGAHVDVLRDRAVVTTIPSHAETPLVRPQARFTVVGNRRLRTAVLWPSAAAPDRALPVLMDPYGGPHAQRVLRTRNAFLASQWLADQGFAVVVVDGRGTPGRGPDWEKAVHGDLAGPVLDDQIEALQALGRDDERLDLGKVAIRGWSFGGYLAALAVLRRPDVFHAAIAGAPVTDWSLYNTHYTERYLGRPQDFPDAYRSSSILEDAAKLARPLLLVHGLADDNVVVAHTLRLSQALLHAGRPHQVLPLSGITHMAAEEAVAENLLRLQVAFLHDALGLPARSDGARPPTP